jgi:hypothetical protein
MHREEFALPGDHLPGALPGTFCGTMLASR